MPFMKNHDFPISRSKQLDKIIRREGKFGGIYEANGKWYKGEWHNDMKHGIGEEKTVDGFYYYGQWKMNKKHGYGTLKKLNEETKEDELVLYEGAWKNNYQHGYGVARYHHFNGSFYKGDWLNGKRHGHGVMVYAEDGSHYVGDWEFDCPHGLGVMTEITGNYYEGSFRHGMCQGLGVYVMPERKRVLRGYWKPNARFYGESIELEDEDSLFILQ